MKKIAVLISAYNGEKFIKDQIESIITQKFDTDKYALSVVVRDDKSEDLTVEIVKELSQNDKRVKLLDSSENLGFAKSFMALLNEVEADYYFLADQDDIWLDDKITIFMDEIVKNEQQEKVVGAFSDAWIANQDAQSTEKRLLALNSKKIKNNTLDFEQQIFESFVAGASLAFNRAARDMIVTLNFDAGPKGMVHDYFIAKAVSCYGKLTYLDQPTLNYRQHGDNSFGARKSINLFGKVSNFMSRVNDIKNSMRGSLIVAEKNRDYAVLSQRMQRIVANKTNFRGRVKFFLKYKVYLSVSHPNLMAWLYAILIPFV